MLSFGLTHGSWTKESAEKVTVRVIHAEWMPGGRTEERHDLKWCYGEGPHRQSEFIRVVGTNQSTSCRQPAIHEMSRSGLEGLVHTSPPPLYE